jgi:sec-independent protein translocase protein TatA
MGEFSIYHWLVVLAIVLLLFGGRRISELLKGLGEGIRSLKTELSGDTNTRATLTKESRPTERNERDRFRRSVRRNEDAASGT